MAYFLRYKGNIAAIYILILSLVVVSCSGRPRKVLSTDKMARVLADIHIAESIIEQDRRNFSSDSAKKALKQSVLIHNNVTSEQFDSSLSWYGYNMDKYVEVYDKVIAYIEDDITKTQALAGSSGDVSASQRYLVEGDSVDVWPDIRFRIFSSAMPTDMITFSLNSDQNWEKGDIYNLSARMTDAKGPVELTLVSEYQDGYKDYNSSVVPGDGWHKVVLALDPDKTATNIYGILRYDAKAGEEAFMDSISLIRSRTNVGAAVLRERQKTLSGQYGR